MKRFLAVLFSFSLLVAGCTTMHVSENPADSYGNTPAVSFFQFNNDLPYGIRYAFNGAAFSDILAAQSSLPRFPTVLTTRILGDQLALQASLDIGGSDTSQICYDDTLSLAIVQHYMACLNEWFSVSGSGWDKNTTAAIAKYRRLYVVEFCRGSTRLQVQGKYIKGAYGIEHLEVQNLVYLLVPGREVMQLRKIERGASGDYYLALGPTYDPIKRTYYPAYFVYGLFGRIDALVGIPAPGPWSKVQ